MVLNHDSFLDRMTATPDVLFESNDFWGAVSWGPYDSVVLSG